MNFQYRDKPCNEYSPEPRSQDAAIFNKVADELRLLGCKVELLCGKGICGLRSKGGCDIRYGS